MEEERRTSRCFPAHWELMKMPGNFLIYPRLATMSARNFIVRNHHHLRNLKILLSKMDVYNEKHGNRSVSIDHPIPVLYSSSESAYNQRLADILQQISREKS